MSEERVWRMRAKRKVRSSPRARMASAGVIVGGMLAYAAVGAAGANGAADETITAVGDSAAGVWDKGTPEDPLEIETGQTVKWQFAGTMHNVASDNAVEADPRWEPYIYPGPGDFAMAEVGSSTEFTFYRQGEYRFVCKLHPDTMKGVIVVEGDDLPIPTPTATPTATATATATATPTAIPTPDDHTTTPPPSPEADATKPALSRIKLRGQRRAVRVTFTLSEPATVTLQVRKRGKKKVVRALSVQARAGTRTVVIRGSKLRKGRYTVSLTARDAMSNLSATSTSALRIRK